jgi:predicted small secreted protein
MPVNPGVVLSKMLTLLSRLLSLCQTGCNARRGLTQDINQTDRSDTYRYPLQAALKITE